VCYIYINICIIVLVLIDDLPIVVITSVLKLNQHANIKIVTKVINIYIYLKQYNVTWR